MADERFKLFDMGERPELRTALEEEPAPAPIAAESPPAPPVTPTAPVQEAPFPAGPRPIPPLPPIQAQGDPLSLLMMIHGITDPRAAAVGNAMMQQARQRAEAQQTGQAIAPVLEAMGRNDPDRAQEILNSYLMHPNLSPTAKAALVPYGEKIAAQRAGRQAADLIEPIDPLGAALVRQGALSANQALERQRAKWDIRPDDMGNLVAINKENPQEVRTLRESAKFQLTPGIVERMQADGINVAAVQRALVSGSSDAVGLAQSLIRPYAKEMIAKEEQPGPAEILGQALVPGVTPGTPLRKMTREQLQAMPGAMVHPDASTHMAALIARQDDPALNPENARLWTPAQAERIAGVQRNLAAAADLAKKKAEFAGLPWDRMEKDILTDTRSLQNVGNQYTATTASPLLAESRLARLMPQEYRALRELVPIAQNYIASMERVMPALKDAPGNVGQALQLYFGGKAGVSMTAANIRLAALNAIQLSRVMMPNVRPTNKLFDLDVEARGIKNETSAAVAAQIFQNVRQELEAAFLSHLGRLPDALMMKGMGGHNLPSGITGLR